MENSWHRVRVWSSEWMALFTHSWKYSGHSRMMWLGVQSGVPHEQPSISTGSAW